MPTNPTQAKKTLLQLQRELREVTKRDPEQEVQGMALPMLDAAISAAREAFPDNPVFARAEDVISPEAIEAGEPVRALDVLLAVTTLVGAWPSRPDPGPQVWSPDVPGPYGRRG